MGDDGPLKITIYQLLTIIISNNTVEENVCSFVLHSVCDVSSGGSAQLVVVSCELLLTDCHTTLSYRHWEHGKTSNRVFLGQVKVHFKRASMAQIWYYARY